MADPREPILVRSDRTGFVAEHLVVESMSASAYQGIGLYLMVPVQNEKAADALVQKLRGDATR